jgi:hypothetical protein
MMARVSALAAPRAPSAFAASALLNARLSCCAFIHPTTRKWTLTAPAHRARTQAQRQEMKQGLLLSLMSLKRLASLDSTREGKLLPHDLAQWGWRYIDEGKVERGAFDSSTMQLWWDKAQLPAELRVRYGGAGSFVRRSP